METTWTSTPYDGFRQFVHNLLIKLEKICQPTRIKDLRVWLSGTEEALEVKLQLERVRHALGLPSEASRKLLAKWTLLPPRFQIEIQQDLSDVGAIRVGRSLLSRVLEAFRRKPGRIMTGWLEKLLRRGPVRRMAEERVKAILE